MNQKIINKIVLLALSEDFASQDITSNLLISKNQKAKGVILFKEDGIVCGLALAKQVFKKLDKDTIFKTDYKDGDYVKKNTMIVTIRGRTRILLSAERTALNFLGYLSGIATQTNQYVKQVCPHKVNILDTRKTTPGLRDLEKYAVRCGGGVNHRRDLKEMVLIKDNHREAACSQMSIPEVIQCFRQKTKVPIEIEVDTLDQFQQALSAYPDMILLDNMTITQMKKAVIMAKDIPKKKRALLEASGGITLKTIQKIAATGVDRISIGALTHTHRSIDVSMEINL